MKRFIQQKAAFTLAEVFSPHSKGQRKAAFTLAEVLITLGIIGVVAAITMPTLIQNHRKTVVETRLQKFYSAINQAITRAEVDLGDKKTWQPANTNEFWEVYLKPYLKYIDVKDARLVGTRTCKIIFFEDGSAVIVDIYYSEDADGNVLSTTYGGHFNFCPEAKYCRSEQVAEHFEDEFGKHIFRFAFWPNESAGMFKYHKGKGVEPYLANWNGNPDSLTGTSGGGCSQNGNKMYCTAVIQRNGWKIPKDYPVRF